MTPPPSTHRRRAASTSLSESEPSHVKKKRDTKKNGRQSTLAGSVDNFTEEFKNFQETIKASSSTSAQPSAEAQMLMEIATPVRRKKAIQLLENEYGMWYHLDLICRADIISTFRLTSSSYGLPAQVYDSEYGLGRYPSLYH